MTVEQLAGDLLPNATLDQLIATGFVRSNMTTNENGVIEEEVRVQYIKDRADTAGTVFLGLTVGCATCHDHKFDPISQKDHYALEAFFNNTTERVMDLNRPDPQPLAIVPADSDRARWLELETLRKSLRAVAWTRPRGRPTQDSRRGSPREIARLPIRSGTPSSSVCLRRQTPSASAARASTNLPLRPGCGRRRRVSVDGFPALKFDGKSSMKLPSLDLTGAEPFSMTTWLHLPKITLHPGQTGGSLALVIAGQMTAGDSERTPPVAPTGWVLEIDEGVPRLRLVDGEGKVIRAQAPYHKPVKAGTWNHLTFTYDGSKTENGYAFYMNGTRMPIERGAYGGQDSTIAPELKGGITNTAAVTVGLQKQRQGHRGLHRGFPHLRSRHQRGGSAPAAIWPPVAAARRRMPRS